ncbi:SRPBCC family protein [Halomonas sp. GT]|uniref:SRPBCC family protein n=1 Tax=Halomonas sp. GT TaxID=1971364 RepID=UPI0009F2AF77|nr:SRPBCC domain-containing protein [Halomonas sp. GT]
MARIEHIQYVNAPLSCVYEVLTTARGLAEVWTQDLTFTAQLDAVNEFRFGDEHPTKMTIVELVPNNKMTWQCIDSDPEWIGTSVSFELEQRGDKTAVTLKHTDWREVTEFYRFCNYNWAIFLLSLKQYCEEGAGIHYQARTF